MVWCLYLPTAALPAEANASAAQFARNFDQLQLKTSRGQAFEAQALTGQVVIYHFIYTGCSSVCPVQTHALARVLDALPPATRARVRIVSVSIDPLGDTPASLEAYARRSGALRPGWDFVLGRPADIDQLALRLRLWASNGRPTDNIANHATSLWLVDAQGRLRMRYDGRNPNVNRLVREVSTLAAPT